jgi:4-amino-4-deoxy-L-arabinose transferase-like glycosyltransferase
MKEGARRTAVVFAGLVVVIIAVAWLGGIEQRGLFFPDEGRYAEIPREMTASGDWVTPRLNGLKYFEKPPLQYWLTAGAFTAFGEDEWTARIMPVILGLASLLMMGFVAWRLWGHSAGAVTGLVLGSSWAYFLSGQFLTLDLTFSACLTFGLGAFLLAQRADASPQANFRWMCAAWVALAFGVLAKGLAALVLPVLALGVYSALARDVRIWGKLHLPAGLAILLAIALPWFLLVQQRNPEFFDFFVVREHLQRFSESGHNRPGAWWYYVPILLLGFMPWTPAIVHRLAQSPNTPRSGSFRPELFCIAWIVAIVVFFSVSRSKLPAYVVPVFPALALIAGSRLCDVQNSRPSFMVSAWGTIIAGLLVAAATLWLPGWKKFDSLGPEAVQALIWVYAAAGLLTVAGASALLLLRRDRARSALVVLMVGSFGFWYLLSAFMHEVDENYSSERLIEELTGDTKPFHPGEPFYSVAHFDHSVPFYLGRTLTLVETRGELGPGIDAEPQKVIPTIKQFAAVWIATSGMAFASMPTRTYEELRRSGLPMHVIIRDTRLVVVSRREPIAKISTRSAIRGQASELVN